MPPPVFIDLLVCLAAGLLCVVLGYRLQRRYPVGEIREAKEKLARLEELFGLTPREREIAGALYISPHTVKNSASRIYEKVGVRTRGQLVGRII
jgi:Bacterial regulatory proteins, luxR family